MFISKTSLFLKYVPQFGARLMETTVDVGSYYINLYRRGKKQSLSFS